MKAILFDYYFEAPDELNDFCKSIGYDNPNYSNNFDLMFDQRVVEFCKQIDVSEFYFGIIDHTKMIINLNNYIEIAVSCCHKACNDEYCENNLKYEY